MVDRITIVDGEVTENTKDQSLSRSSAPSSLPAGYVNVEGFGPVPENVASDLAESGEVSYDADTDSYSAAKASPAPNPAGNQNDSPESSQRPSGASPRSSVLNPTEAFGDSAGMLGEAVATGNVEVAVEAVADASGYDIEEAREAVASAEHDVRLNVNNVLQQMGVPDAEFGMVAEFAAANPSLTSQIARAAATGQDYAGLVQRLGNLYRSSRQ